MDGFYIHGRGPALSCGKEEADSRLFSINQRATVNLLHRFLPSHNNYTGIRAKSAAGAFALSFVAVLLVVAVLSIFSCQAWVWAVAVSLTAALLLAALFYGFFRYIKEFAKKMEKSQLTVRRTQAKRSDELNDFMSSAVRALFQEMQLKSLIPLSQYVEPFLIVLD